VLVSREPVRRVLLWAGGAPQPLFLFDELEQKFVSLPAPVQPSTSPGPRAVTVGDLNGDTLLDLLLQTGPQQVVVLLQDRTGGFRQVDGAAVGLASSLPEIDDQVLVDFDRDGRLDVVVTSRAGGASIFLNQTSPETPEQLHFALAPQLTQAAAGLRISNAAIFQELAACDHAVDLALGSVENGDRTVLQHFPDASERKTVRVTTAAGAIDAPFRDACVEGGDGPDRISGHRLRSHLSGGGGDDELIAKAGVTVMRGGAGKDTFRAAGFTLIQLPPEDIVRGEKIDCGHAEEVLIDSPLSIDRLKAAGVEFEHCFAECGPDEDDCHAVKTRAFVADLKLQPGMAAMEHGSQLGFVSDYGFGFGTCNENSDCWGLGLDLCRIATGEIPSSGQIGACYPSSFNGVEGPVPEWCFDPFFARLRREEVEDLFFSDDRQLVLPLVFWIVRSDATDALGNCSAGSTRPNTLREWHDDIAATMSNAAASYGRWGIKLDYQFRVLTVPSDSEFVVDPVTDRCRTYLELPNVGTDANKVQDLLAQYPTAYRTGELNAYLTDSGGIDFSGHFTEGSKTYRYLLLRGGAGAFKHEFGHGLGLAHPQDGNSTRANLDPDHTESRDNWLHRPFPDVGLDRLHICTSDAQCSGADADPGNCLIAPGASAGFCQNLKRDCALDGDHVCDTPWDAAPCFQGTANNLGAECTSNADCQGNKSSRGTAYLTYCGGGFCIKRECTQNSDCGSGSFCAEGTCVIWKEGISACCDMHTDRGAGFDHNACYQLNANGNVVHVSGVGAFNNWPLDDNTMTYHDPYGRGSTATEGQRDEVVCISSYRTDLGPLLRKPQLVLNGSKPCSLRPGDGTTDYAPAGFSLGPNGTTMKIAHGACSSGVCEVLQSGSEVVARCVQPSCSDGVVGQGEASVDCGGVCPDACPFASACASNNDCLSGSCARGTCQPSCEDGVKDGSEISTDAAGRSFDSTCPAHPSGGLCRYDADCSAANSCRDDATCILSSDCPINSSSVACAADMDCRGGKDGSCVVMARFCSQAGCATDAECPSGACILPEGRCKCSNEGHCPGASNQCVITRSMCLDQCTDGRCLGTCTPAIGIP
jgi:FG-GAP-like repeat